MRSEIYTSRCRFVSSDPAYYVVETGTHQKLWTYELGCRLRVERVPAAHLHRHNEEAQGPCTGQKDGWGGQLSCVSLAAVGSCLTKLQTETHRMNTWIHHLLPDDARRWLPTLLAINAVKLVVCVSEMTAADAREPRRNVTVAYVGTKSSAGAQTHNTITPEGTCTGTLLLGLQPHSFNKTLYICYTW